MSQYAATLHALDDRLDTVLETDQVDYEYVFDGEAYSDFTTLLQESALTEDTPEQADYADLVDDPAATDLLASGPVAVTITGAEGTVETTLDAADAETLYDRVRNRSPAFDTSPAADPVRPQDTKRVHWLHDQPVLTLAADGDTTRYGVLLAGQEKGRADCTYVQHRFPGDLVYFEGTVDAPIDTVTDRIGTGSEDAATPTPAVDTATAPVQTLEDLYTDRFGSVDTFTYHHYRELADTLASNLVDFSKLLGSMENYLDAKKREHGLTRTDPDDDRVHRSADTYRAAIDRQFAALTVNHDSGADALRFTDLGVFHTIPVGRDDAPHQPWADRLETEAPDIHTYLADSHPNTATATDSVLAQFRPDTPTPYAVLLSHLDTQGLDAIDDLLDDQLGNHGADPADWDTAATWDGNETTSRMYQ